MPKFKFNIFQTALNTGAHQLVSRIPNAVDRAEAGHRLRFDIDVSTVHLFETESGTRLV